MTANRIVSLVSSATEILFALGLGDRVVAVSHECDFPQVVQQLPRVTSARIAASASSKDIDDAVRQSTAESLALYELDVEQVAALAPDLIVTQAQCDVCAIRYQDVVDALRSHPALSKTHLLALNPCTVADVLEDVRRVAEAAGETNTADGVIADLQGRIRHLSDGTADLAQETRTRVACIEWIEPLMLAGNWVPELIHLAGGTCNLPADGRHSTYANWQTVVEYDPQVIVVAPCGFDIERTMVEVPLLELQPDWRRLSAVRNARTFVVDGNAYFNRPGPRLVDTAELLAYLCHPERFGLRPTMGNAFQRVDA